MSSAEKIRPQKVSEPTEAHAPLALNNAAAFRTPFPPEIGVETDVVAALKYGLDLVKRGALLVQFDTNPCLANRTALDILARKDGLFLSNSGIVADRVSDTRLLVSMLREVITSPLQGEPKDSPMSLPRKKTPLALIVRVVPGPDLSAWPTENARTALMTIFDPDLCLRVDEGDLTRLYGLTRGEAAFATLILQGKSIEEAAAELFISVHTARTHLKRIFLKTDTHRQPELVVRLLSTIL